MTRAADYGTEKDRATYFRRAKAARVVSLHIETVEAVRNLDELLEVGGADVYFIGPGDLAASMGYAHDLNNAEVVDSIGHCIRSICDRGFIAGTLCTDVARTKQAINWGAHDIVTAVSPFIIQSVNSYLREVPRD